MIGICNGPMLIDRGLSSLKRDILFFDKLVLLGAKEVIGTIRERPRPAAVYGLADEIEYLLETPFFQSSSSEEVLSELYLPMDTVIRKELEEPRKWFQNINQSVAKLKKPGTNIAKSKEAKRKLLNLRAVQVSLVTRLEAERLSENGELATSNESMPVGKSNVGLSPCTGDVIQLAINFVPLPGELTSWDDIFALRADKDVVDRARKLRLWSYDQARSGNSLVHIQEIVADALSDYENSLKAYKVKFTSSIMQSALVGTAGFLEDLLKLRFEKAAERFFSVRKSRADMLLAEVSAPGKELSLVTMLRDRFTMNQD